MKAFALLGFVLWSAAAHLHAGGIAAETTWRGFPAWKLSDGRSEAIVVPQLGGRLLHFGLIGGTNFIWSGDAGAERGTDALYWGGDKTYIGPHTMWQFTQERMWPPPPPNTEPHQVLPPVDGALLITESVVWPGHGGKVRRSYTFDEMGELVITHSIAPVAGTDAIGAVWTVAQTIPSDAIFMPLAEKSPYKDGFFAWGPPLDREKLGVLFLSPTLLQLRPPTGSVFKIGAHPPKPALASLKNGVVFLATADPQKGLYPEGGDGAGLSVEIYHHNLRPPREYTELEFLSPLGRLDKGLTLVTRWSLRQVVAGKEREQVEKWLQ
jgi:hypothetical protein